MAVKTYIEGPQRGLRVNIETNPLLNAGDVAASAQNLDFQAMARKTAEMQAQMMQMSPEAMVDRYASVTMNLPLIQYGQTGSWSDIEIQTNKGRSYNPNYMRQRGSPKFLGRVSVTEYTKFVIAGTFSAEIYSQEQTGIFASEGSISGRFRGTMPVADDPRYTAELTPAENARMDASAVLAGLRMVREGLMGGDMFTAAPQGPLADDSSSASPIQSSGNMGAPPGSSSGGTPASTPPLPSQLQGNPNIAVTEEGPCVCVCQQMAVLPPQSACRRQCESRGLQCADESQDPGADALLEELREFAPTPEAAQQMYDALKDMSPAQRAQLLEMYRAGNGG